MLYAQQIEGFAGDEIDKVIDGLRVEVEPWVGRSNNRAGECQCAHVLDIDEIQRGFAVTDDQGAAFLEGDCCGSGEEV